MHKEKEKVAADLTNSRKRNKAGFIDEVAEIKLCYMKLLEELEKVDDEINVQKRKIKKMIKTLNKIKLKEKQNKNKMELKLMNELHVSCIEAPFRRK